MGATRGFPSPCRTVTAFSRFMRQLVIQCRFGNLRPLPALVRDLDTIVLDGNTTVEAGEGDEMPKSQILPSTGFLYRSRLVDCLHQLFTNPYREI